MVNDHICESLKNHEEGKSTDERFVITASDSTELLEGSAVYRNYEAEPMKGKIVKIDTGRHGTGFILVDWADGSRSMELSSWLRTDPEMVYSHPMWETVASKKDRSIIAALSDEKEIFANAFGLRIYSNNQGYDVHVNGAVTHCNNDEMLKQVLGSLPFETMPEDESVVFAVVKEDSGLKDVFDDPRIDHDIAGFYEDYRWCARHGDVKGMKDAWKYIEGLMPIDNADKSEILELHDYLMYASTHADEDGIEQIIERMDGMMPLYKRASKRTAGVWAVPHTLGQVEKLFEKLQDIDQDKTYDFEDKGDDNPDQILYQEFFGTLGDDDLWDKVDKKPIKGSTWYNLMLEWLKKKYARYQKDPKDFSDKFDPKAVEYVNDFFAKKASNITAGEDKPVELKVYDGVTAKLKRYIGQDINVDGLVVDVIENKEEEKKTYMVSLPMYGYKVYEFETSEVAPNKEFKIEEQDKASADKAYSEFKKIVKKGSQKNSGLGTEMPELYTPEQKFPEEYSEDYEDKVKRLREEASEYYGRMKISPDQDDILDYVADALEYEMSGIEPDMERLKDILGYVEEE